MSGNKSYTVEYLHQVAREDIPNLPKKVRDLVKNAIEKKLMVDPISFAKPLRYSLKSHRRLCVSEYRIVYRIDAQSRKVIIVAIKHRKDVYD